MLFVARQTLIEEPGALTRLAEDRRVRRWVYIGEFHIDNADRFRATEELRHKWTFYERETTELQDYLRALLKGSVTGAISVSVPLGEQSLVRREAFGRVMTSEAIDIVGMIPARMGSSRFPGKPLASILGLPMIEHVYHRVAMCESLRDVYVATCDQEIREVVEGFGGKAVMTSNVHQRASDRIAEAVEGMDVDIVVMVQGDEPMTHPTMVEQAVAPMLTDPGLGCVNLTKRITDMDEFRDPNTIKVVMDQSMDALFFSRQPIPTVPGTTLAEVPAHKQVCVIPFRRDVLLTYSRLEPTPLEQAEFIDMMRFLEHGYSVRMVETEFDTHAVDTLEDLKYVEEQMRDDPLITKYESRRAEGLGI
jgi:3-deoxy-manno-octulosonate cytidylyltransferase (CMP-KDO synthetase)